MNEHTGQSILVLGSTGSVGINTLDVIQQHPETFKVLALAANQNNKLLYEQCRSHKPRYAHLACPKAATQLQQQLKTVNSPTQVLTGEDKLISLVADKSVDTVVSAIVGAAGLPPTLAAAQTGKRILLANKESLVIAGELLTKATQNNNAVLLPIDSEHNAIFQCLPSSHQRTLAPKELSKTGHVKKVFLTASGGPFWKLSSQELDKVTPQQALAHPVWSMGPKISIDSATMMNKGLELIEACWLFGLQPDDIQVIIHPQGVVHSMVEYIDGAIIAQMAPSDLRVMISHGLSWPQRTRSGVTPLDPLSLTHLQFYPPDSHKFPSLRLARQAMITGGTAPAILNAANEEAVCAFLKQRIGFTQIVEVVEKCLTSLATNTVEDLSDILEADAQARSAAQQTIKHCEKRYPCMSC